MLGLYVKNSMTSNIVKTGENIYKKTVNFRTTKNTPGGRKAKEKKLIRKKPL